MRGLRWLHWGQQWTGTKGCRERWWHNASLWTAYPGGGISTVAARFEHLRQVPASLAQQTQPCGGRFGAVLPQRERAARH